MNFCPQCGTRFEPEARFCQECGFDINSVIAINELIPKSIIEPSVIETAEPTPLPAETLPIEPELIPKSSDKITQPVKPVKPIKLQKRKPLWPLVVLVTGVLVTAGWFGYKMYFLTEKDVPIYSGENKITSENVAGAKAVSGTKTVSLMDQELAKQKEKEKQRTIQKNNPPDVGPANQADIDIIAKVILTVGHKEEPKNKNPKNASKLILKKNTMITRITTDHYNDGMGTPRGGKIAIKDRNNNVIVSYKALGLTGKNGTPSARWVVEPNIMLEKGTYLISDSDPSTWSKTLVGGNGFVVVEGYEVE